MKNKKIFKLVDRKIDYDVQMPRAAQFFVGK